jgi:hypothetical protein
MFFRHLVSYSYKSVCVRQTVRNRSLFFIHRQFTSKNDQNQFSDILNKVKGEYNEHGEKVNQAESNNENDGSQPKSESNEVNKMDYLAYAQKALRSGRSATSTFISGLKETWTEMVSGNNESKIRRTVVQATSARTQKPKEEADEGDGATETPQYDGPSALVVSKSNRSTWEEMTARLENSPLIREMLKNSRKIKQQAAGTDIGKQAQKIGEEVSNKIHVRLSTVIEI